MNIDRLFLLECIDIAGNIEVVIVVDDLLHRGTMAVLLNLLALTVGIDNLADMFGAQFVLRLNLLKLFARVDEQNVVTCFAALLDDENAGRDARAIEDVGRQTYDCVDAVALLNKELADFPFGSPAKQHAVQSDTSHRTAVVEVVYHVEDKGVVGFRFRCQNTRFAETVVVVELRRSTPVGRERRIGDNGIELLVAKSVGFECVAVLNIEVVVLDTVQQHIHASKVEGRRVLLLPEQTVGLSATGSTEQQ